MVWLGDFAGELGDLVGDGDFPGGDDRFSGPAMVAVCVELLDRVREQVAIVMVESGGESFRGGCRGFVIGCFAKRGRAKGGKNGFHSVRAHR